MDHEVNTLRYLEEKVAPNELRSKNKSKKESEMKTIFRAIYFHAEVRRFFCV